MNNTMLAENLPQTFEDSELLDTQRATPAVPFRVSGRRQADRRKGLFGGDGLMIAALVVCFFAMGSIGVVYVAAFARVQMQAQDLRQLNKKIADVAGQREALIKELAVLQSDHRITAIAVKMSMSPSTSSQFVCVSPERLSTSRQVASAL